MTKSKFRRHRRAVMLAGLPMLGLRPVWAQLQTRSAANPPPVVIRGTEYNGDFIVAVVNSDLVTAAEVEQRVNRVRTAAARGGVPPPATDELRRQALDSLIDERVITTYARESGIKVDDAELDRAVQSVAAANRLTPNQLRDRLRVEGIDYARFRSGLRDQIMAERVREREVIPRIRVQEVEIDEYLAKHGAKSGSENELDIAQILVTVPEGAGAEVVEQRRQRAEGALARVQGGEDFAAVAREVSEDGNRQRGGAIGLRPASRLPDPFVAQVRGLRPGQVSPTLLRTGAGFHVIKLVERKESTGMQVTQTRPRHILLRPSAQLSPEVAQQRLTDMRAQIERGSASFEALARQFSEDASAAQGGDLGWVNPGSLVPEFEEAMNRLPVGGISQPVVSRFGVHLIQVVDRREATIDMKQLRDQARNALREQKFEATYLEWLKDLRTRAYIEMREPP